MASRTSVGPSRVVNMLEAKTHLSRLVEAIETGAEAEVVIARTGRSVARLTSLQAPERTRRLGIVRGKFVAPDCTDGANPLIADHQPGQHGVPQPFVALGDQPQARPRPCRHAPLGTPGHPLGGNPASSSS